MNLAQRLAAKVKEKSDKMAAAQEKLLEGLKTTPEIRNERYNICLSCDKLYKPTSTCKVCGCFMQLKTWMPEQRCPLYKWLEVSVMEAKKDEREGQ